MVRRFVFVIFSIGCLSLMASGTKVAAEDVGLGISPVRQEMTIAAGATSTGKLTVANLTGKDMEVAVDVMMFSVTDKTYDYRFRQPEYDWVKPEFSQLSLRPQQSTEVKFTVAVPQGAASGGYYFVLLARTTMATHGITSTVQAAMPLYVTVDGSALRRAVAIENPSVPLIVLGGSIPYSYDVKNTGNVHVDGHFVTQLTNVWGSGPELTEDHTVFPQTTRRIAGILPSLLLPGVYKLTYGIRSTSGDTIQTAYIVNIPPWLLVAIGMVILLGVGVGSALRRQKRG